MPDSDQELERLKRLRERQLTDRDPLVKQRQFQRSSAQQEKRRIGVVVGRAIDTRENIKDLIR